MNWDRVEIARRRARGMLLLGFVSIFVVVLAFLAAPGFGSGLYEEPEMATVPVSMLLPAAGLAGILVGLIWMWRIYRAPTEFDTPRWRYRDR